MPSIYALLDPRNGHARYVGQTTVALRQRLASHCAPSARLPALPTAAWLRDLHSIGLRPEITELEPTPSDQLDAGEQYWIATLRALGCDLTNRTRGGHGLSGFLFSKETRAKISAAHLGISKGPMAESTKLAIGLANRGRKRPQAAIDATAAALRGQKRRPEVVAKMSVTSALMWKQPGHAEKMARAHGGRPFVDQHGNRYETINGAARSLGLHAGHVCNVLKGHRKSTGGYVFRYAD